MPFQEKSDERPHIDLSRATQADRLKVTFENGLELYFKSSSNGRRELAVDSDLTSRVIVADLHQKVLEYQRDQESRRLPFMRKRVKLVEIQSKARLFIFVEDSVFDGSPLVGSPQEVWGTFMGSGTVYPVADNSPVARVESITID